MEQRIQQLLNEIRHKVAFDRAELLQKGHSNTKKYILYQSNEPSFLLRVYEGESLTRCTEEYKYLNLHFANKVRCQKPLFVDEVQDLQLCYLLLTYTKGESGEEILLGLTPEAQYLQGITAGRELNKIHKVTPDFPIHWAERRFEKYLQKKSKVDEFNIRFHKQEYIESYIEDNIDMIRDSPVCFQHDDFHPSNLIFNHGEYAGVIDFSRFDWGDPWEEFFKIPKYTCYVSTYFANGQVQGYFNQVVPDGFWPKYNLFVALNQHASLIGGVQIQKVKETLDKIEYTIETHDFVNGGPPRWFLESRGGLTDIHGVPPVKGLDSTDVPCL